MSNSIFIGRKQEVERLEGLYKQNMPSLVVIKGRRRIGKSRLILEFSKKFLSQTFWSFSGLAPQKEMSAQEQRDNFARQLALILKLPPMTFQDWNDAFEHLGLYLNPGDIILFDEISWMAAKDPSFIPKLKAWWDKQNKPLFFVLCGSVSTWIEENILKTTAFFGRINLIINLEPLSISEGAEFLEKIGMKLSDYDIYKILSIVGGIPWYLQQFNFRLTADDNIKQLAFEKDSLFLNEFNNIFHDLFNGKGGSYKQILNSLVEGAKTLLEIRKNIKFVHSGTLSAMMDHLAVAGFVQKQALWSFKTKKPLKQSLYRISDPYIRFYLKMLAPNLEAINNTDFKKISLSTISGFDVHMGLQLETLLIQNKNLLLEKLDLLPLDIIRSGPYRQKQNSVQQGCQIDYLIQTKTKALFLCEFKFRKREISSDIIEEMQEKIKRLKVPRGFAVVPVLFHLSGVSSSVENNSYFYRIIDISDFLKENLV